MHTHTCKVYLVNVSLEANFYVLTFLLGYLSINVTGVLKSPIILPSVSPIKSINICFT